ncbi:putative bifunctional diguanylate cyclase/phosphodiesterase [Pelovirga terrestris]|uniref:EAL domain-containing protein n=1 Tax=Pelovirga terrestris TaxID=2771352 RepID=A0A8J6QP88_9BACT|nr:EAL domain-containing protein [Pelovirga terrestris]MBD1400196.1 EAL domain-containing protein [Pelovirga terrestris]
MLILIVDDEIKVAQSLQLILKLEGFEAQIVTSGAAAFEELARHPYDIALLDLNMPQIDGMTVLDHITRNHPDTSVIVVSGESEIRKAVHVLKAGARDFVRKPYTPEELIFSINNVREKIQLERDNQAMIATLQESEALHKFIVHHSPDLVYMLDHQGNFTFVNNNTAERLGYKRQELMGRHYSSVVYPDDLDLAQRYFMTNATLPHHESIELRLQGKNKGNIIHAEIRSIHIERKLAGGYRLGRARKPDTHAIGTYGVARDISEKKRAEEIIRFQNNHDLMTGLPNRSLFHERLEQLLSRARSTNETFALILIDINRFKLINDTYSQAVGDSVLRSFAERLGRCCTAVDTLARIGGDEFALLMPTSGPADTFARARAERIVEETMMPIRANGHDIHLSVSLGITIYPDHGNSCQDLMKNVDTVLCNLKNRSINSYGFYNTTLENKNSQKVFTENLIRQALKNDQLIVHYQPLVQVSTLKVASIEALARIQLSSGNILMPTQFIETAEETPLIHDIGARVIEIACRDLKDLNRRGIKTQVSINVSAVQLQMENFAGIVLERIHFHRLRPQDIELELTENVLIQDLKTTVANIVELAGAGVNIAVDDFGTGYSSLCYLDRLPLNTLKLDKSFIQKITPENPAEPIIPAMIRVAEGLQLRFVAEGIETRQQHEYLLIHGGTIGQGYYYSRPVAKEQIIDYMLAHHDTAGTFQQTKSQQASPG